MRKPAAKKPAKATKKATTGRRAQSAKKTNARNPARAANGGVRDGSKLETIVTMLKRPEGCTTKEVLEATKWPSVSMPQQAKAAGIKLLKEKDGAVTRYRAG